MKVAGDHDTDEPILQRGLWDTVQRRYEKIRYGPTGRIIGYLIAFACFALFIFATIMIDGYNSR